MVFVVHENVSPHFEKGEKGGNFYFKILTPIFWTYNWKFPLTRKITALRKKESTTSLAKMVACQSSTVALL